ncbi:MAG TPA: helix-hairpin-helix domain-containing protein, partial [Polyangiaceae bacterium]|nr:helix-hairpin-helix domain-containing protein [Polyangiaceae bacterium]
EALARAMYRLGFRALEELAEATIEELVTIDGIAGPEEAEGLRNRAASTMERLRRERIAAAKTSFEPPTERDVLRLVRGVGVRTQQLLEEGGYRGIQDVVREDPDRLAIRSGLSHKKARAVQAAARDFMDGEAKEIEAARAALMQSGPSAARVGDDAR